MNADFFMYFNIGILVFYAFYLISGYRKGFLLQVVSLAGMILSIYLSWRYSPVIAKHMQLLPRAYAPFQETIFKDAAYTFFNRIVCYIALFFVLKIVFFLIEKVMSGIQDIPFLKQMSGFLGAVVGGVIATFWVVMISFMIRLPFIANGNELYEQTYLKPISEFSTGLLGYSTGPSITTDALNQLYTSAKSIDGQDVESFDAWLEEHDIEFDINK